MPEFSSNLNGNLRNYAHRKFGPCFFLGGGACNCNWCTLDRNIFLNISYFVNIYSMVGERSCKQSCGVGVETGVGVGRSRAFWLKLESELKSVKFSRLRLQPGVAG